MEEIGRMGEDRLIEELLKQVPLGEGHARPGDDCAVMEGIGNSLRLLKTDAIVEGLHWLPGTDARRVGWKAVARVISDMAAMGGRATEFLITLAMPKSTSIEWATQLYQGMSDCLKMHGGVIVGGETTSCPDGAPIFISVAATGIVERSRLTLRSGAKPGNTLLVTGLLGGSISGKHLDFRPRIEQAAWLTTHFKPTAMMDLSDGLAKDLPRLAMASNSGFKLQKELIPRTRGGTIEQALGDGEDYELLFAIESNRVTALLESWSKQFSDLELTVIGELCAPGEGDTLEGGWDHFG